MSPADASLVCRRFAIIGRVQGVWFRDSTRREAQRLGVAGYAKNRADGSVEVVAAGKAQAVEQLLAWLHQGPTLAKVTSVTELESTSAANAHDDFQVL